MPFDGKTLSDAVAAVLLSESQSHDRRNLLDWRDRDAPRLLGADPAMLRVLARLSRAADTRCAVLIEGKSGTGKELAARSLHASSARTGKPFVTVNCAEIPRNLVELELLGIARGGFAGVTATRPGRFDQADGGTIFLEQIDELDLGGQAMLLRLIETRQLLRIGEVTPHAIDVRIVAATNRNLQGEIAAGCFRADLYFRLNVISIEMPTLRSRPADIVLLSEYFLKRANERHRRQVTSIDPKPWRSCKRTCGQKMSASSKT